MTQDVWKAKGDQLDRYLRMDTFPLGVNFLRQTCKSGTLFKN